MSEITKCQGGNAQLCQDCWRRLAPEGERQEFFPKVPLYDGGKCEEYWKAGGADVPVG
jgi:hypothetical protein